MRTKSNPALHLHATRIRMQIMSHLPGSLAASGLSCNPGLHVPKSWRELDLFATSQGCPVGMVG